MLKELLLPLVKVFPHFNVFQYITFRSAYAAITALVIAAFVMPIVIGLQRRYKLGEKIRKDGPDTHAKKAGTPTMGGIVICFAIAIAIVLWMDIRHWHTWVVLFLLFGFGFQGFIDDYLKLTQRERRGLRAWTKISGQMIIGTITGLLLMFLGGEKITHIYFPFIKHTYVDIGWFYVPFVMLVIISSTNAVNLTDGLDGLAAGLSILMATGFSVIAYVAGRVDFSSYLQIPFVENAGELSIVGFAIIGACVGFLWYNCAPASIMMGDTGSLTLGALLSVIAIMVKHEILLLIMGGVFVIETLSVIIQVISYKLFKKRVFKMAPLHHHFEMAGWKENKVVVRFWIVGGFFLILALSTLKLR